MESEVAALKKQLEDKSEQLHSLQMVGYVCGECVEWAKLNCTSFTDTQKVRRRIELHSLIRGKKNSEPYTVFSLVLIKGEKSVGVHSP